MRFYPDSNIARDMAYYGDHCAYDAMRLLERFLRPGDRFLDLGANVGVFTCLAASLVGAEGLVESFEPSPRTFARLQENVALNGWAHVRARQVGLGAESGSVCFTSADDTTNHVVPSANHDLESGEMVPIAPLDDLLGDGPYTFAKLDVEGYELPCLRGSSRLLRTNAVALWIIEVNGSHRRYGFREDEMFDLLRDAGYELGCYQDDGRLLKFGQPFDDDVLAVSPRGAELLREWVEGLTFRR